MKNRAFLAVLLISTVAAAEPVTIQRTLKDTTTLVALDLNPKTVFCTNRGYGTMQLKISVPDLDWLAHFDHRVVGETLPCITGGECTNELKPGNIIAPQKPIAIALIRVTLNETLVLDSAHRTCTRLLTEGIAGTIRGKAFNHYKAGGEEPMSYQKCVEISKIQ